MVFYVHIVFLKLISKISKENDQFPAEIIKAYKFQQFQDKLAVRKCVKN